MMAWSEYKNPNLAENDTVLLFSNMQRLIKIGRTHQRSEYVEYVALGSVFQVSFSPSSIFFTRPSPFSAFSLSKAPLRGPASLWLASLGLTGLHRGCWESVACASHHQGGEVGGAGQLTLNWGLELPAPGWIWPCKAQEAFSTWNSQGIPLERLRYGAWKAGGIGRVDAGSRLEGGRVVGICNNWWRIRLARVSSLH